MVIRVDKIFGGGRGRGEKRRMKVGEEWEWTNQGHQGLGLSSAASTAGQLPGLAHHQAELEAHGRVPPVAPRAGV